MSYESKRDPNELLRAKVRAVEKAAKIRKLAFDAAYRDALDLTPKQALGSIVVLADELTDALKIIYPEYWAS